jgi:hypothetical protein
MLGKFKPSLNVDVRKIQCSKDSKSITFNTNHQITNKDPYFIIHLVI